MYIYPCLLGYTKVIKCDAVLKKNFCLIHSVWYEFKKGLLYYF